MSIFIFPYIFVFVTIISLAVCEPPKRIIMGTSNQIISIVSDCEQYEILTNYKHISIKINNINNLDRVLITDKVVDNCTVKECNISSNICQSKIYFFLFIVRSVNSLSETNFDTKMCIRSIYVNVRRAKTPVLEQDGSTNYSFSISASYITGGSCMYIHENAFAYCGESDLNECRNCKRPGCNIIECGNEVSNGKSAFQEIFTFNKQYELCVPYTESDKDKLERCTTFSGVTTYKSSGLCEYDDLDGYSSISVFVIGLAVIAVLVFSIAVIYYNVYLIKYKCIPFSVPAFLPEFLFPRGNGNLNTRTTMDNTLDDVFARDNRQNF